MITLKDGFWRPAGFREGFTPLNVSHPRRTKGRLAEGVGFEPTVELPLRLISSQVPLTTQPPFHSIFWMETAVRYQKCCMSAMCSEQMLLWQN